MAGTLRFDRFELDTDERILSADGHAIPLQDLPMRLLIALVEKAPQTIERSALAETLWEPGTHLDVDASLNTAVARVREALGDDASDPRFVATVPRRGYRFVASLDGGSSADSTRDRTSSWSFRWRWLVVGVLVVGGLLALAWGTRRAASPPPVDSNPDLFETFLPQPGLSRSATPPSEESVREQLLVGHHHADRRTREGLEKAIASFQSAVALDPESEEAYSGLALSYSLLGIYDYWRPLESFQPARTMARRALELDPSSAEAHLATGLVAAVADWDWAGAKTSMRQAVTLAADSADAWYWQGALLSALGEHTKALESTRHALSLNPTSPVIGAGYAWHLFRAGRPPEAIAQSRRTLELHPDYYDAWDNLKWIQLTLGHEAEALEAWVRADDLDDGRGDRIRLAYRSGGLAAIHREAIKSQVRAWESGHYQSPFDIALEFAALGDVEGSLEWLARSFAERETDLVGISVDPRLDPLRSDPRFQALIEAMGFPAANGWQP